MLFGASRHVVLLIRFSHHVGCRLVHPDMWYYLFGSPIMSDAVWYIPTRGITYSVLPSCRMPFVISRHVVLLIRFSHHEGCRLVHPDVWYQLNVIRHQHGCRLVHPAKWDIGKFWGAFMTNADWCILLGDSFGTLFTSQFRRIPFGESRPYHHSLFIRLSIITFNFIFTFILSFKDKLNLCTYFIYSFIYSFTYTHSYIHSRILIHTFMYTRLRILIHILIYVYSFIHSFTYTHSYTHFVYSYHLLSFSGYM